MMAGACCCAAKQAQFNDGIVVGHKLGNDSSLWVVVGGRGDLVMGEGRRVLPRGRDPGPNEAASH